MSGKVRLIRVSTTKCHFLLLMIVFLITAQEVSATFYTYSNDLHKKVVSTIVYPENKEIQQTLDKNGWNFPLLDKYNQKLTKLTIKINQNEKSQVKIESVINDIAWKMRGIKIERFFGRGKKKAEQISKYEAETKNHQETLRRKKYELSKLYSKQGELEKTVRRFYKVCHDLLPIPKWRKDVLNLLLSKKFDLDIEDLRTIQRLTIDEEAILKLLIENEVTVKVSKLDDISSRHSKEAVKVFYRKIGDIEKKLLSETENYVEGESDGSRLKIKNNIDILKKDSINFLAQVNTEVRLEWFKIVLEHFEIDYWDFKKIANIESASQVELLQYLIEKRKDWNTDDISLDDIVKLDKLVQFKCLKFMQHYLQEISINDGLKLILPHLQNVHQFKVLKFFIRIKGGTSLRRLLYSNDFWSVRGIGCVANEYQVQLIRQVYSEEKRILPFKELKNVKNQYQLDMYKFYLGNLRTVGAHAVDYNFENLNCITNRYQVKAYEHILKHRFDNKDQLSLESIAKIDNQPKLNAFINIYTLLEGNVEDLLISNIIEVIGWQEKEALKHVLDKRPYWISEYFSHRKLWRVLYALSNKNQLNFLDEILNSAKDDQMDETIKYIDLLSLVDETVSSPEYGYYSGQYKKQQNDVKIQKALFRYLWENKLLISKSSFKEFKNEHQFRMFQTLVNSDLPKERIEELVNELFDKIEYIDNPFQAQALELTLKNNLEVKLLKFFMVNNALDVHLLFGEGSEEFKDFEKTIQTKIKMDKKQIKNGVFPDGINKSKFTSKNSFKPELKHGRWVKCYNQNCPNQIFVPKKYGNVVCDVCGDDTCTKCQLSSHQGRTCEEIKKVIGNSSALMSPLPNMKRGKRNICFMNAVHKIISTIPNIEQLGNFSTHPLVKSQKKMRGDNVVVESEELFKARQDFQFIFGKYISAIKEGKNKLIPYLSKEMIDQARNVLKKSKGKENLFEDKILGEDQHDAHEFMLFVLNTLDYMKWAQPIKVLRDTREADKKPSYSINNMLIWHLGILDDKGKAYESMQDAMDASLDWEKAELSNDEFLYSKQSIVDAPPFMFIQLNRFTIDYRTMKAKKLTHNVELSDIEFITTDDKGYPNGKVEYYPVGAVIHKSLSAMGNFTNGWSWRRNDKFEATADSGHYITLTRDDKSSSWVVHDDEKIEVLDNSKAKKELAKGSYIVLYKKGVETIGGLKKKDIHYFKNVPSHLISPRGPDDKVGHNEVKEKKVAQEQESRDYSIRPIIENDTNYIDRSSAKKEEQSELIGMNLDPYIKL